MEEGCNNPAVLAACMEDFQTAPLGAHQPPAAPADPSTDDLIAMQLAEMEDDGTVAGQRIHVSKVSGRIVRLKPGACLVESPVDMNCDLPYIKTRKSGARPSGAGRRSGKRRASDEEDYAADALGALDSPPTSPERPAKQPKTSGKAGKGKASGAGRASGAGKASGVGKASGAGKVSQGCAEVKGGHVSGAGRAACSGAVAAEHQQGPSGQGAADDVVAAGDVSGALDGAAGPRNSLRDVSALEIDEDEDDGGGEVSGLPRIKGLKRQRVLMTQVPTAALPPAAASAAIAPAHPVSPAAPSPAAPAAPAAPAGGIPAPTSSAAAPLQPAPPAPLASECMIAAAAPAPVPDAQPSADDVMIDGGVTARDINCCKPSGGRKSGAGPKSGKVSGRAIRPSKGSVVAAGTCDSAQTVFDAPALALPSSKPAVNATDPATLHLAECSVIQAGQGQLLPADTTAPAARTSIKVVPAAGTQGRASGAALEGVQNVAGRASGAAAGVQGTQARASGAAALAGGPSVHNTAGRASGAAAGVQGAQGRASGAAASEGVYNAPGRASGGAAASIPAQRASKGTALSRVKALMVGSCSTVLPAADATGVTQPAGTVDAPAGAAPPASTANPTTTATALAGMLQGAAAAAAAARVRSTGPERKSGPSTKLALGGGLSEDPAILAAGHRAQPADTLMLQQPQQAAANGKENQAPTPAEPLAGTGTPWSAHPGLLLPSHIATGDVGNGHKQPLGPANTPQPGTLPGPVPRMRFGISKRGLGASAKYAQDPPGSSHAKQPSVSGGGAKMGMMPGGSHPPNNTSSGAGTQEEEGADTADTAGAPRQGAAVQPRLVRKRVESESGRGFGDSGAAVSALHNARGSGRVSGGGSGSGRHSGGARLWDDDARKQPGAGEKDATTAAGAPSDGAGACGGMFAASRPSAGVPFRVAGIKKKRAGGFKAPRMAV